MGRFTNMRMQKAYLLIFLAAWIHFDDVLLTAFPTLQHVPLAADDDKYLSTPVRERSSFSCSRLKAEISLKPETADLFRTGNGSSASLGSKLTCLIAPSHLDSFMSLQL